MMKLFPYDLQKLEIIFLKEVSGSDIISVEVIFQDIVDRGVTVFAHFPMILQQNGDKGF